MADSALDVFEGDHEVLAGLFRQVRQPQADRRSILQEIIHRLAEHVAVERSLLYPVVRHREIGGPELASQLLRDYNQIEHLLVLIERRKVNSPDMPDLVTDLIDVVEAHMARAETVLGPAVRAALAPEELEELRARAGSAERVILSHPHPHLLSLGPLSRLTTRFAAEFDRLRDRTVNNRIGIERRRYRPLGRRPVDRTEQAEGPGRDELLRVSPDVLDDELAESFPASDPPSHW